MLIGLGPEVYFDIMIGVIMFTMYVDEFITIILSFGTPVLMSFKINKFGSVVANPIYNNLLKLIKNLQ
jgi:hypothetical protein